MKAAKIYTISFEYNDYYWFFCTS